MTEIRAVENKDFSAWSRLWSQYLHFYRADLPEETTSGTFDRLVHRQDGLIGLVAVTESLEMVGLVHIVLHPSTWSPNPSCYVEDLFVASEARGGSIAEDLIRAAYEEADRIGASRTYWQTQQYNGAARSLYDKVGHPTSFIVYER